MVITHAPHVQPITDLANLIGTIQPPIGNGSDNNNLSKEQLISIFFKNDSEYNNPSTTIIQYTAPFQVRVRICTPNEQESSIINSSEDFQLYVTTEHLLLYNLEHAFKIHFSDILMHGVQQQPNLCLYCQLACDGTSNCSNGVEETNCLQMEEDNDEEFENVCEMIIQLQVQSSALDQIYNQMYQAFSRAAENVPLNTSSDMQDDDNGQQNGMLKFDPRSLDDKLSISNDGWIYNVEEMRRGVLIRDRSEREDEDDDWEDVDEEEDKSKKLKM